MTAAPRTGPRSGGRAPSDAADAVRTELADVLAQLRTGHVGVRLPRRGGLAGQAGSANGRGVSA